MEENNNKQGFWVENSFEPNPDYQPKRKPKKHAESEPDSRYDRPPERPSERHYDRRSDRQPRQMRSQSEDIMYRSRGLLQILSTYLPGLSTVMTLGSGLSSLFGGFGKLLKWGCLILVIGFVVIVALIIGVATFTGTEDEVKGKRQTETVVESKAEDSNVSEDKEASNPPVEDNQDIELLTTDEEPVGQEEAEPVVEDEVEPVVKEEEAPVEEEKAEPVVEKKKEPAKTTPEPKKVQPKKQNPRKQNTVNTPQKTNGSGFKLEKVDRIPTKDQPSSNKKGTGFRLERIEKE